MFIGFPQQVEGRVCQCSWQRTVEFCQHLKGMKEGWVAVPMRLP